MNTLLKAVVILLFVGFLFIWSKKTLSKRKVLSSWLLIIGSACLVMVSLVHIFEATHLFAFMGWGNPYSVGHYLDFTSAILGFTLFPVGLILYWTKR